MVLRFRCMTIFRLLCTRNTGFTLSTKKGHIPATIIHRKGSFLLSLFYRRFKRQQALRYSYLKNLPITPAAGKTRIVD